MRRRPEEDDQEQHDGLPAQRTGDSGPAHEDGHTSGCATPDDVLPGTTLENHRVDEDVERDRDHDEDAGQEVGSPPQPQERRESEKEPEDERVARRHRLAGQRTLRRALHDLVDVGVDDAVERVRTRRAHPATEEGAEDQNDVDCSAIGQQHCRNGCHQQQFDHSRLRERDISQNLARCATPHRIGIGRPRGGTWAAEAMSARLLPCPHVLSLHHALPH